MKKVWIAGILCSMVILTGCGDLKITKIKESTVEIKGSKIKVMKYVSEEKSFNRGKLEKLVKDTKGPTKVLIYTPDQIILAIDYDTANYKETEEPYIQFDPSDKATYDEMVKLLDEK